MNNLQYFIGVIICFSLLSCQPVSEDDLSPLTVEGVSRELAVFRKEAYHDIRYGLTFFIPESKDEPVTGKADITFRLTENQPVIIDFLPGKESILSIDLHKENAKASYINGHILLDKNQFGAGEHTITIEFKAGDAALNRRDEFLYTLFVPDRARTVFPCFDQPDLKALYSLQLDIPSDWEAVANGAVKNSTDGDGNDRKHIQFDETEPLSTYLFSFVAGKLNREQFNRGERNIAIYHRETETEKKAQCADIANEVFDALEWLEEYTSIPYPFAKYDVIILPGFQFGGMEHTGATLYTDRRMFLNEQPTLNERLSRSALIAHETAHMWFGDYVTMQWFDDVWTKEVFANYFASLIVEPLYPAVNHRLNFIRGYYPAAYSIDRTIGANPIKQELDNLRNAGLIYGQIIYNKSPIVMEMLVNKIGEEAFQKGIREYLKTYAYGNADWEGLIRILDKYAEDDLKAWSKVWVNEEGMAEITSELTDDKLIVAQTDPFKRGLIWPQELKYLLIRGNDRYPLSFSFTGDSDKYETTIPYDSDSIHIIPNMDGNGYGFFHLKETDAEACLELLSREKDEVLKGSLLINLYENLLHQSFEPEWFMEQMLKYALNEQNNMLYSMALGYIGNCGHLYITDRRDAENALLDMVEHRKMLTDKLQALRLYISLAESEEAVRNLYNWWRDEQVPAGCVLSERDFTNLSYKLAVCLPGKAEEILSVQRKRITQPDRLQEFDFIGPSVSPDRSVRDSVFNALLQAENRNVEPWVTASLSNLNHSRRQEEALSYIYPALEALEEIQRTGDIFFPTNWLSALLSSHTTVEARDKVSDFLNAQPDYPLLLKRKILQQQDHLYRINE